MLGFCCVGVDRGLEGQGPMAPRLTQSDHPRTGTAGEGMYSMYIHRLRRTEQGRGTGDGGRGKEEGGRGKGEGG